MRILVLECTPLLGVGIVSLNQDHKRLIGSYNDLIGTLVRDSGRRSFLSAFDRFRECADRHFAHEELVMRNINYAGYSSHKAAHDRLRADACDFLLNIEGAYTHSDLPIVARYFRYWLIHILLLRTRRSAHLSNAPGEYPHFDLLPVRRTRVGYWQTVRRLSGSRTGSGQGPESDQQCLDGRTPGRPGHD